MLVSHISEIRPERDYPELSAICQNEMRCGINPQQGMRLFPSKETGLTAYPDCIQTGMYARRALIPPERQRMMLCALEPNKTVPNPAPMATCEDGQRQKQSARGTPRIYSCEDVSVSHLYILVSQILFSWITWRIRAQTRPLAGRPAARIRCCSRIRRYSMLP